MLEEKLSVRQKLLEPEHMRKVAYSPWIGAMRPGPRSRCTFAALSALTKTTSSVEDPASLKGLTPLSLKYGVCQLT